MRSRRQFLLNDVSAMVYAAAVLPLQPPPHLLRYGERLPNGDKLWYSWPKIRRVLGLRAATEQAFYDRLQERYDQLTKAYLDAVGNGSPDFEKIFGGRMFDPPTTDIPRSRIPRLLQMPEILAGNTPNLRRLKSRIAYSDDFLSLGNVGFSDGSRVIKPGYWPLRRGTGKTVDSYRNSRSISVIQYSNGSEVFNAEIHDIDLSDLVLKPDEQALAESVRENLMRQARLFDIDERAFRDIQVMKQALDRLNNTGAVKKYLKEVEEARKAGGDGAPETVEFTHPYPIYTEHSFAEYSAEKEDHSRDYLELLGQGILRKDVVEIIEMPMSSPLAHHASDTYSNPRYRMEFLVRDMPKEAAEALRAYYRNVISNFAQAEAVFSRV